MSQWTTHPIEKKLEARLKDELGGAMGIEFYSYYVSARQYLLDNVFEEIKTKEPNLSDHGPKHIFDVLNRAYELAGPDLNKLKVMELYILCLSIQFHDVGNLEGRTKHNKNIARIYDAARNNDPKFATERNAVLAIAGAHTGLCNEGTKDTLKDLPDTTGVFSKPVRYKMIGGLLRFADELAEGKQRTSRYMQDTGKYSDESLPFHRLANVTDYTIDRDNKRIEANYQIYLEMDSDGNITDGKVPLLDLLDIITTRIIKVNEERVYCRYYSEVLSPFQEISVAFTFVYDHEYLDAGIKPLKLNDLVVPGNDKYDICAPGYSTTDLFEKITKAIASENEQ